MLNLRCLIPILSLPLLLLAAACGDDSDGNTGGGGTGGGAPGTVNDCDSATAEDHTGETAVTIDTVGITYDPACIRVAAGTAVTFMSDFVTHPLIGGEVKDGAKVPATGSPIATTTAGTTATFTMTTAGSYGYYCDVHALAGMKGAIFVE